MKALLVLAALCGGVTFAAAPAVPLVTLQPSTRMVVGEGNTLAEARSDAHAKLPQGAHVVRFEQREANHKWYFRIYYTM